MHVSGNTATTRQKVPEVWNEMNIKVLKYLLWVYRANRNQCSVLYQLVLFIFAALKAIVTSVTISISIDIISLKFLLVIRELQYLSR